MAGRRGRARRPAEAVTPRRSTRSARPLQDDANVPGVFRELLAEEQVATAADPGEEARPQKKRRTRGPRDGSSPSTAELQPSAKEHVGSASHLVSQASAASPAQSRAPTSARRLHSPLPQAPPSDDVQSNSRFRQTIIDSDESEESDMEWEDALQEDNDTDVEDAAAEIGDISITFRASTGEKEKTKRQVRRRAITSVDKKRRLDIHKMHILCLLYHVHRRNAWCNDARVQAILRRVPSPKTLSSLIPNPDLTQYQASKRFTDGLNELKLLWSKRFNVTAQSMHKPRWAEVDAETRPFSDFDQLDDPLERDDFRRAASTLQGSSDLGQQLFCALLRAIGIEARLVCSLQCLPFASAAQPSTPHKSSPQKNTIVLDPYKTQVSSPTKPRTAPGSRPKRWSRLERALGVQHPKLGKSGTTSQQQKGYQIPYPVYWVEAFNAAHQKWVSVDSLSTFTVNAAEKLEPPLSSTQNTLVYAIAFDDDYTAKDVTRRYAKAFNAKTRKFRVESTPGGEQWWRRTMNFFQRQTKLDRDQLEDTALSRKVAAEGMPKAVQDFKNHPVYVLERHLRHNEVIHPMNPVGRVNVGSSMNPKMESIYRRRDVHVVRSADKWYRMGRDVRDGEQPLKHAKLKKGRRLSLEPDMDLDDAQEETGAGLYAEFQTELYIPPPVVRGRVPRNAYGNLDLYVPTMCPPGGVHVRHKLASKAARLVGVDYAEAVTGFSFKGRHGTAVVQGVVVAQEYAEAVMTVIEAMEYAQEEAETRGRSVEALRLWRRFCVGLRIAQRVNAIQIDGETGPTIDVQEEMDREDKALTEEAFAGGFFPDEGENTQPVAQASNPPTGLDGQNDSYGGGFTADEDLGDAGGGFIPEGEGQGDDIPQGVSQSFGSTLLSQQQLRPRRTDSFGGGFQPEDYEDYYDDADRDFLRDASPDAGPSNSKDKGEHSSRDIADYSAGDSMDTREQPLTTGSEIVSENKATPAVEKHNSDITRQQPEENEIAQRTDGYAAESEQLAVIASAENAALEPPPDAPLPSSTPSDNGSLPLEDPEDSDADPDWLVEAT